MANQYLYYFHTPLTIIQRLAGIVQPLVVIVMLILFFQGKGAHGTFIAIMAFIPVIRLLLSQSYRNKLLATHQELWGEITQFAKAPHINKIPLRAVFIYTMLPTLVLSLVNGVSVSSLDNYPTIRTAISLVVEDNTELTEATQYHHRPEEVCKPGMILPYWLRCTPTGVYAAYPLGMLAITLPVTYFAKWLGADLLSGLAPWRLSKWIASWVAATIVALFFVIALHFVSLHAACFGTLFIMLGSAVLSTISQGLWSHGGVVLGFLAVLLIELRMSVTGKAPGQHWAIVAFVQGVLCAFMFACRLSSVALLVPVGVWLVARAPVRAIIATAVALLCHAPLTYYYWNIYQNAFGPQMQMATNLGFVVSTKPLVALVGLLTSPSRGLLVYQPWILLCLLFILPGIRRLFRESCQRLQLGYFPWLVVSCVLLHVLIISLWPGWWGGDCWGSRLLTETVIPLAILALFPVVYLLQLKWGRVVIIALLVVSFLVHAPGVFTSARKWTSNPPKGKIFPSDEARFWDWSDPPFLYAFLRDDDTAQPSTSTMVK